MAEQFGERLRALRQERGLSQTEVGGSELSTSYISRLESGTRAPSRRVVALLADRLEADPAWLLTGATTTPAASLQWNVDAADLMLAAGQPSGARDCYLALQRDLPAGSHLRRHVDHQLARAHERCAALDEAIELLEELLQEARRDPSALSFIELAIDLSRCYREAGSVHRAVEVAEDAVERLTALGLQSLAEFPRLVVTLAGASRERGDHAHAQQLLRRLLDDLGSRINARDRGSALWNAALVAAERGQHADATVLARRALDLFEELADQRAIGLVRTMLAWILLGSDEQAADEALSLLTVARELLLSQGLQIDTAYAETELARATTALGRSDEAIRHAQSALDRLSMTEDTLESARARTAMGHAMLALGEGSLAVVELERAADLLSRQAATRQSAAVWRELAEAHAEAGDLTSAMHCMSKALEAVGIPSTQSSTSARSSALR